MCPSNLASGWPWLSQVAVFAGPFSKRFLCALGEGVEPKASALYPERTPVPQSRESVGLKEPRQVWGLESRQPGTNQYGPAL